MLSLAGFRRSLWVLGLAVVLTFTFGSGCAGKKAAEKAKASQYHYQMGANYFSEQMAQQALRELLLAVEVDPNHADALHLLGFIYLGRRDYPRAIEYLRKGVAARKDFYICLNNLGTAYMASGRWEEAVEIYEELINKPMYNTPELAYNNLGWSYHKVGEDRRAEETLQMALFLKPEMCLAYNNLGQVQLDQGNRIGALRNFMQAIKRCPAFTDPHFHTAQLLRQKGDPQARLYYQRCWELAAESTLGDRCRSYLEVYP